MITELFVLVLAIPTGFILAWLTKEELADGRKWFRILLFVSLALAGVFFAYDVTYGALTCVFIAIVSLISLIKSQ